MIKKQFKYLSCANRSLLSHGLYHNGDLTIICCIFKESENSDIFQFWHFPIQTLSDSDMFRFWHYLIFTLSNFFQHGQKLDSDTFQFWHFPFPLIFVQWITLCGRW